MASPNARGRIWAPGTVFLHQFSKPLDFGPISQKEKLRQLAKEREESASQIHRPVFRLWEREMEMDGIQ